MKTTKILAILVLALGLMVCLAELAGAAPMGTGFTYQGRLVDDKSVANGIYDFQFKVFDNPDVNLGEQQGSTIYIKELKVKDGNFTVELDFGSGIFTGDARWLEIAVSPDDASEFVTLSPRQEVTPTPYAICAGVQVPLDLSGPKPVVFVTATGTDSGCAFIVKAEGEHSIAVCGRNYSSASVGVWGYVTGSSSHGVDGEATGYDSIGVQGESTGNSGEGVRGRATASDGIGVHGVAVGGSATGVHGHGGEIGVYGQGGTYDFFAHGAGTSYGAASSIRWKNDVRPIDDPLGKVLRLRGVYFNWDEEHGGQHDVGMIAEEVGEVLPEIVEYEENGIDATGMDYGMLAPLLVEAVKALKVEVNELQRQNAEKDGVIETLRQQNDKLEGRLAALESSITTIAVQLKGGGK